MSDPGHTGRREFLSSLGTGVAALGALSAVGGALTSSPVQARAQAPVIPADADNFYTSDQVNVQKVRFRNQYQLEVAGNLYTPKALNRDARNPALVVSHPMGAVKEQSANLYATKMAEQGFVTLSVDLPCWGESEGPRNLVSPDLYAEAFSAAVDFLGTQNMVDRERIGAIGICGSGSFVISAAKIDPRMKAIATVSMYDMGAANRHALNESLTLEQRKAIIAEAAQQRWVEFTGGALKYTSGTVHELTAQSTPIEREFHAFLPHTARRSHARRRHAADHHAPHADEQRQVLELLPVQ